MGDLNADGRTDIAFILATANRLGLLFGRGDGSFQDSVGMATTGRPQSLVVADVDDDGIVDALVGSTNPNSLGVLLGRVGSPGGLVESPVDFTPVRQVGMGDIDNDGRKDLLFREYDPTLFVLRGQGSGVFHDSLAYPMLFGDPWCWETWPETAESTSGSSSASTMPFAGTCTATLRAIERGRCSSAAKASAPLYRDWNCQDPAPSR